MSVAQILSHSSNVGAVTIGLEVGAERFSRWINRFGFGRPTGVQFPAEEQGIVPALEDYSGSTMGNLPIGQGISVTPMQMVAGYDAIANGGILRPPQLIEKVGGEPVHEPRGKRVINASVAAQVRDHARGRPRPGGHRLGGQRPRLHARRQDRDRRGGGERHLLGDQVRRLLHRLRPRPGPEAAGRGDRRPAARATSTAARWRRRRSAQIASFALPYLGDRASSRPAAADVASSGRELRIGLEHCESRRTRHAELASCRAIRLVEIVRSLAYDSRKVRAGTLFFCVPGFSSDGHDFAPAAVEAGAAALVVERELELGVPRCGSPTRGRRWRRSRPASSASRPPTLAMAGVTGTNGKTTTAFLLREILEAAGAARGLLGTVMQVVGGVEEEVVRTTPEAIDLQATFRRMLDAGDGACVMEVSSHALALHRCDAIRFDVALFTNLTQDHLDFHADMEDYFQAKRMLFAELAPGDRGRQRRRPLRRTASPRSSTASPSRPRARRPTSGAVEVGFDASGSSFVLEGPRGASVAVRTAAARATSTSPTRSARSPPPPRSGCRRDDRRRRRWPAPGGCPAASSRSTRARASRSSSTTPTPPTRSTTSSPRPAG